MAWAAVGARGSSSSKAAGTTLGVSIASLTIPVGSILVAACVSDNFSTSQADTTDHSVGDSKGNTWIRLKEYTNSSGSAKDGITSSLWASQITTALLIAVDSVTLTLSGDGYARALGLYEYSVAGGNTFEVSDSYSGPRSGTVATYSISGLTSAEYLWLAVDGMEGPTGDTYTQDPDYVF